MLNPKVQYLVDASIAGLVWVVPNFITTITDFANSITIKDAADALIRSMQLVTTLLLLLTAFYRFLKSKKDNKKEEK